MHTNSLHCTAHVSEGPNDSFEEERCREGDEVEQLMSEHVIWTKEAAAVSVSLS